MEAAARARRAPAFPVEVWREVANHMTTSEWAGASTTCRAMSQVQPKRMSVGSPAMGGDLPTALRWMVKHCSEAEDLSIGVPNTGCEDLAEITIAGSQNLAHVQNLMLEFTPYDYDDCMGFDEAELPWLAQFLTGATQLTSLTLEGVRIDVKMLSVLKAQLKHLELGFKLPFPREACLGLQDMHGLETLHLSVEYYSPNGDFLVKISGLDLSGCRALQRVDIGMLEPDMLSVPSSCYLSVERDILGLDRRKWEDTAPKYTACVLYSNRYKEGEDEDLLYECPRLAGRLTWLSQVACPNLTWLELDYPKLTAVLQPLVIDRCMGALKHLRVSSNTVYVKFGALARLDTLILTAVKNVNIHLADVSGFAAGLEKMQLKWKSCCSNTYRLATALTNPADWDEQHDLFPEYCYTEVIFPVKNS